MDSGAESNPAARLRLRITAAAESKVRSGHPWLYAESVREQNREGQTGELAVIYDRRDRFLAVGLFDPESPLRVRVLHAGRPVTIDLDWWRQRLKVALERRRDLFDEQTTGYRCINGESDGWPGLVLDRYDTTLVLKLYTAAWLPRLGEMIALIRDELKPERVVLRLSRNVQTQEGTGRPYDGQVLGTASLVSSEVLESNKAREVQSLSASPPSRDNLIVTFLETGLRFEADVVRGQKTGFFLDQRENRRRVEALANGRDVLNAFSFSGGFSLYAARGGARSARDLDVSTHALETAKRNFALNRSHLAVACCRHETVQADAFEWLERNATRRFDLVILDPPSLAKREVERTGAVQAYRKLAAGGIHLLRAGGVLLSASCSAHVSPPEFFEAVRQAARQSGRKFEELDNTGHPPDHPATFPEAQYLKCIYLRVR